MSSVPINLSGINEYLNLVLFSISQDYKGVVPSYEELKKKYVVESIWTTKCEETRKDCEKAMKVRKNISKKIKPNSTPISSSIIELPSSLHKIDRSNLGSVKIEKKQQITEQTTEQITDVKKSKKDKNDKNDKKSKKKITNDQVDDLNTIINKVDEEKVLEIFLEKNSDVLKTKTTELITLPKKTELSNSNENKTEVEPLLENVSNLQKTKTHNVVNLSPVIIKNKMYFIDKNNTLYDNEGNFILCEKRRRIKATVKKNKANKVN
jgi:hypothetical protein